MEFRPAPGRLRQRAEVPEGRYRRLTARVLRQRENEGARRRRAYNVEAA